MRVDLAKLEGVTFGNTWLSLL